MSASTPSEPPLKTPDVAAITGYTADEVRRMAKAGIIPAFRYAEGAEWRFNEIEVRRWMRGGQRTGRITTGKRRS